MSCHCISVLILVKFCWIRHFGYHVLSFSLQRLLRLSWFQKSSGNPLEANRSPKFGCWCQCIWYWTWDLQFWWNCPIQLKIWRWIVFEWVMITVQRCYFSCDGGEFASLMMMFMSNTWKELSTPQRFIRSVPKQECLQFSETWEHLLASSWVMVYLVNSPL